ncbi:hypothetical protein ThvES_00001620 [Thiovulum sp. ES]|nr:hypothetical protein ThvES_00001620 [Thiovulum sp. ES]
MVKHLLSISAVIFLSNCSAHANRVSEFSIEKDIEKREKRKPTPNENFLLLIALDGQAKGEYVESAVIFKKLFEDTGDSEYSLEYLKNLNALALFEQTISEFSELKMVRDDKHLREVSVAYISLGDLENGYLSLSEITEKKDIDYRILAEISFQKGDFNESLQYLKESYEVKNSDEVAIAIAKLLFNKLNEKDQALDFLEKANRDNTNLELSLIYAKMLLTSANYIKATEVYSEIYEKTEDPEIAQTVIKILNTFGENEKLLQFLKDSKYDDDLLLRLYMRDRNFEEGFKLSKRLYEESEEPIYLAQNAIFEYENLEAKFRVEPIIEKLEKVVNELNDPTFYNYLGYLMIQNNIRILDGLEYVKKALVFEPDNFYIVDSLAWGLYKIRKCSDAKVEMQKVIQNLGAEESEIKEHWEKIQNCK